MAASDRPKLFVVRRVVGASMAPTLLSGWLVVGIYPLRLKPGNIVIFVHKGREKIKRLQQLEDERAFVVGDNLAASTDSRSFGWIARDSIIAKLVIKF